MNSILFSLALRNIIRQRARSAATLTAIAIGVAGLILAGGFVQDIFIQLGEAMIHSQTGHFQVTKQGYREGKGRSPDKYLIENPDALKANIQKNSSEISQTMARSINTSLTTLFTIGMVYILGVSAIKEFALPIIVGLVAGTYSSVLIAGPLWVILKEREKPRARRA